MNAEENIPYEKMHWQTLKKLVEEDGEKWVDVKSAADHLNARDSLASESGQENTDDATTSESDGTDESTNQSNDSADDAGDQNDNPKNNADNPEDAPEDNVTTNDDLVTDPVDEEATADPCFMEDEPYGTVSGGGKARYWQNGYHFDCMKKYIDPEDIG